MYLHVNIIGNQFILTESSPSKPVSNSSALHTLKNIQKAFFKNLLQKVEGDSLATNSEQVSDLLKQKAFTIKKSYMEKSNKLSFLQWFFGGVFFRQWQVKRAFSKIERLHHEVKTASQSSIETLFNNKDIPPAYIAYDSKGSMNAKATHKRILENKGNLKRNFSIILPRYVEEGNKEVVSTLLHLGANPNYPNNSGALYRAVEKGNLEMTELLLNCRADPNYPHNSGALYRAVEKGDFKMTELLLNCGANPNVQTIQNQIPLNVCSDPNIARVLIKKGADVNLLPSDEYAYTPLQTAAKNDNIELVRILLDSRAKVNLRNHKGETALCLVAPSNYELFSLLLKRGAKPNVESKTKRNPLHNVRSSPELTKLLLQYGADVNYTPEDFYTALDWAKIGGFSDTAKILSEWNAKR